MVLPGFSLEFVLFSSLSDIVRDLGESSFDSLFDFSQQFQLFLSLSSGGVVFLFNGSAQTVSVVQQLLVSVSLSGGSEDDSGLVGDADVQFGEFFFQLISLGFQMLDGGF